MTERVNATKMEQKALLDKEEAVKRNIRERHATIVAAADKFRDEALKSVSSVNADIKSRIDKVLKQQEKNLGKLVEIQQNLDQTVRRGTSGDVIAVTKEMRNGCGSEDSVGRLMTTQEIEGFFRPVLRFSVTADVMVQKVHDFLGTVSKVHIEAEAPEVKVVERFRCWKEANTEIFSLCHVDGNAPGVWVSYERCNLRKDAPVAKFDEHGTYLSSSRHSLGKISHRRYAKGLFMRTTSQEGKMSTFSKSITAGIFRLDNDFSGRADIVRVEVNSPNPLTTETTREFTIKVGAHRAFDVDDTGQFFAVVEEARFPDVWRKVLLYRRPEENACVVYTPQAEVFQPSDVCFCKLHGQSVLLVADELNDAIHVVGDRGGMLVSLCCLAPGSPSLIQPTAMTIDTSGRLWVACRGGYLITIETQGAEQSVVARIGTKGEKEDEDGNIDRDEEIVRDLEARLHTLALQKRMPRRF